MKQLSSTIFLLAACLANPCYAERSLKLVSSPSLSPDGESIAFSWMGEIWTADIDGANVQRLTNNDARDSQPLFSPDGESIAFVSDRTGSRQIFVMNVDALSPKQVTFHSEGYSLEDWFPDGKALLATGNRDHYHRDATRLLKVHLEGRRADVVLADAMAEDAKLSADGSKILFTREGERWWRKGYTGERSAQVWMLDLESGDFTELLHEGVECMWPNWMSSGQGFYFTKGAKHGFDLWQYRFPKNRGGKAKQKKVAGFDEDSVVYLSTARDGNTLIFRHLFDLYSWSPGSDAAPKKINLTVDGDIDLPSDEQRRELDSASEVAFSEDGLDIAFIAGGDVWVMDTKLREPRQVTNTPGYEESLKFSPDGESLWFTATADGKVDIHKATKGDSQLYWWQCEDFDVTSVTDDMHVESDLTFTPNGKALVFQQGRGDLVVMDLESNEKRMLVDGFSGLDFDISPDSRWIAYSKQDDNFNTEIWISDLAGKQEPVNVSRHPDNDYSPKFSPDGKILAFTGRRIDTESDVYYVYLQDESDQETSRDRRLEEALALMKKKRPAKSEKSKSEKSKSEKSKSEKSKSSDSKGQQDNEDKSDEDGDEKSEKTASDDEPTDAVEIDFDGIHERLRRISVPNSFESGLLFSPDGKKLAFSASVSGKRGWYTVTFPSEMTPKFFTATTGSQAVWSAKANAILMNRSGIPTRLETSGKTDAYSFELAQVQSRGKWLRAGFDGAWLAMREVWYDENFANRNWDQIRRKYADVAESMVDTAGLSQVVELMLGELNGSHLGFTASGRRPSPSVEGWRDTTAHLGVRFEAGFNGPGLKVRDVIPDGPADRVASQLESGDVILQIDSTPVDPAMDLTTVLNGRLDRDIELLVSRGDEELRVALRPISFGAARSLLYSKWLEDNRQAVAKASDGKLGYLHIRAMDMGSFYRFERELYNVGYGREGIVIDVRDNGGGSTTDRLLTALTQPRHAITVPRGGGRGYPQDRAVYATWYKPIIVLCNQNSYSNAEIFSHAVKTLGRGKVVGVRTAGGVVSTGSATINDVGRIRVPFRGWFVLGTGDDMEMNGCKPDVIVWPTPGELPQGEDRQLHTAVETLLEEIGDGETEIDLIYATERGKSDG